MNVPENELLELRSRVAKLYGEDAAQDTVVRVLAKDYHHRWFEWELRNARRQWIVRQRAEDRAVVLEEKHHPKYTEESRIDARVKLRKVLSVPLGNSLVRYECGKKMINSGYLVRVRRKVRRAVRKAR